MTATQDLIAAALTAADDLRKPWSPLFIHEQAEELRELCARAMVQPVGEVPMPELETMDNDLPALPALPDLVEMDDARWGYRAEDMRDYGEDCCAAGYAAGVVAAEARADETRRLYNELLHQVGMKYPGETRHETAIRYLRLAEIHVCGPAVAALRGEVKP